MPNRFWSSADEVASSLERGENEKNDQRTALWLLAGLLQERGLTGRSLRETVSSQDLETLTKRHGIRLKAFDEEERNETWETHRRSQDIFWTIWRSHTDAGDLIRGLVEEGRLSVYITYSH